MNATFHLKDRLSGRVVHVTKPGLKPYLSMSSHLVDVGKITFGKARYDVICLVETNVKQKGMQVLQDLQWLVAEFLIRNLLHWL